jgi:hypothetical protein
MTWYNTRGVETRVRAGDTGSCTEYMQCGGRQLARALDEDMDETDTVLHCHGIGQPSDRSWLSRCIVCLVRSGCLSSSVAMSLRQVRTASAETRRSNAMRYMDIPL